MNLRRRWVDTDESIRIAIVHRMINSGKRWLSMSEIADLCKVPSQRIAYHLPYLVSSGVVIQKGRKYRLQEMFYHIEDIIPTLELLVRVVYALAEDVENVPAEKVVQNCLTYLLAVLSIDVEED